MSIEASITAILRAVGEDPQREGLQKTPARVAKAYEFLCSGYLQNPADVINGALFAEKSRGMVIVRDIEIYSLCEHHMLPFFGRAHIAYIPNGKVIGVSKIPRLVDIFARRLQIQERLTDQIADVLVEHLNPLGVAVTINAKHLCMMMRGVEKQNSVLTTSAMRGVFEHNLATRDEFLKLISL